MTAYFIQCRSFDGLMGISTTLYYSKSQAEQITDELNAKKDGYNYFVIERAI
jgi:hypothetical protein